MREFFNLQNLLLVLRVKALKNHYSNVGRYFQDQRLRQAFTFQDMYVGLSPYKAPAMFSLLQYSELVDGVWFPKGGMYSVVEALMRISSNWGVEFLFDSPVDRIDFDNHHAKGVTLSDGRRLEADVIIANADLPYVYDALLSDERSSRKLDRKEYTCSTLMFFWGVEKQYTQLKVNNLFFGKDYRQSFSCIMEDHALPESPSFYVHAPVRVDPSMAPEEQESLTVVVPVGHINDAFPQDWSAIQGSARDFILRRLAGIGIVDLEKHIKFEFTLTPLDWQRRYNLVKGSTHGLSHSLLQMGYLRPRNRHEDIHNLYFVGASTHPGTGLPTVLMSAKLTAERILQEIGNPGVVQTTSETVQQV
jgi:phytoene desaturase